MDKQEKPDIDKRSAIEQVVSSFYQVAMKDPLIGHFFTEVVALDLETHLPRICDFWESTLFYKNGYDGNPVRIHQNLHAQSPLEGKHFDRWITLFNAAIDQHYQGEKAELMKTRALSIRTVMEIKLNA